MSSDPKVSFVVPCYNEEKNVAATLETIRSACGNLGLSYEAIVVDDGSRDGTGAAVERYRSQHPDESVILVKNEINRGLSYNYFKGAEIGRGEYYMAVFGDHSEPVEALLAILRKMGQADIVIPYIDHSKRSFARWMISKAFSNLINCIIVQRVRYFNGPVLHKRADLLGRSGRNAGFGCQAELLAQLLKDERTYVEVLIPFNNRISGGSSAFRFSNFVAVSGSLWRIFKIR